MKRSTGSRRGGADEEIRDEIAFHLEMETEAGIARGLSPRRARSEALRRFGGVERARHLTRDARGDRWLREAWQDLKLSLRSLARTPGFTVVAVLTLALGVGANAAIFGIVDGVLLEPVPWKDPERLVMVWETDRASDTTHEPSSVPDVLDMKERAKSFEALAAFSARELTLLHEDGDPERVNAVGTSHDLLPLLGLAPTLGGPLPAAGDEPGAASFALLSESLWRSRYDADPDVVGRVIDVDGEPVTVVGVAPDEAGFGFLQVLGRADYGRGFADNGAARVDLWLSQPLDPVALPRHTHPVLTVGRLKPGVSLAAAGGEMTALMADLEAEYPDANANRGAHLESLPAVVLDPVRPALTVLLVTVALVLLVACANVANLLLARGAARRPELAVRRALGAGNGRLLRQFLVEGWVLAGLSALIGLGVAWAAVEALPALAPADVPRLDAVAVDGQVVLAALALALVGGVVLGLVTFFQARGGLALRGRGSGGLRGRGDTGRTGPLRRGLVVAEVALAVVLVCGAALLLQSFRKLLDVDLGFDTDGVVKAEVQLPSSRYPRDFSVYPRWPEVQTFLQRLVEEGAALPGVESAALAGSHPLAAGFTNSFRIEGREEEAGEQGEISIRQVSPSYFETVGARVRTGRSLRETDDADGAPVVVLNATAADRYFPDGDAVGRRLAFWGITRDVVGVVGDERFLGADEETPPALYVPIRQAPAMSPSLLLRTTSSPTALAGPVRDLVRELDPQLAVFGIESLADTFGRSVGQRRFLVELLGAFAAVALGLALLGIYGVLAYQVVQRRRELGVRMALGAGRGRVVGGVLGEGVRLATAGVVLGLALAFAATRLLRGLLYGVEPTDGPTFAAVGLLLLAAALASAMIPAFRATRVDPARVLQAE